VVRVRAEAEADTSPRLAYYGLWRDKCGTKEKTGPAANWQGHAPRWASAGTPPS
jgi:hypothetical protein